MNIIKNIFKWILLGYQDGEIQVVYYFSSIPKRNNKLVKWEELSLFQYMRWLFNTKKQSKLFLKETKVVPKQDEIITLIDFLNRYRQSARYNEIMEVEKDTLLKCLLQVYKESFLEEILKEEVLVYKDMGKTIDISIENPYVGDLHIALGRLRSYINNDLT